MSDSGNNTKKGKGEHKTQIIVAIIGLIGVIATGIFTNWNKIFPEKNGDSQNSTSGIYSDFNSGTGEGWKVQYSAANYEMGGHPNSGNSYIKCCDNVADGKTAYFVAPSKFHGDWRSFRELKFSLSSKGGKYYAKGYSMHGDVRIMSGSMSAEYSLPSRPAPTWDTFVIPLKDATTWTLKGGASTLQDILANVTSFEIRAEFGVGGDCAELDDVMLVL